MNSSLCRSYLAASGIFRCWFLLLAAFTAACGGSGANQSPARTAGVEPSSSTQLPTTYVTPDDAGMISTRLEEANGWLLEGSYERAAAAFDQIVAFEPEGQHAAAALYNAGFAYEQLGQADEALVRYRKLIERFAEAPETRGGLIRAGRLYAHAEDWEALVLVSEHLLARPDLAVLDRIEALGAHGLGLVEQGQVDRGALSVSKARTLIEDNGLHEAGKLNVSLAEVFFALGEVRRIRGEQIVFVPVPGNFAEVLEQRCQSLLDAQDAYATAMRAYDPHWSAMAGYRVGGLYQQLHRDLMRVPPPQSARTERQRQLFEGAMQLRYRVLLEKGLKMMERTVAMADRTGESSTWVHRAKDAKQDLERALEAAKESLAKLPYTEQDLQRALDDLAGKKTTP
jgi:tetratricopeptide (TPR) repeat protein